MLAQGAGAGGVRPVVAPRLWWPLSCGNRAAPMETRHELPTGMHLVMEDLDKQAALLVTDLKKQELAFSSN